MKRTYTITRKIELRVLGDSEEKTRAWERLREIDYLNFRMMNHTMSTLYMLNGLENVVVNSKLKNQVLNKLNEKELKELKKKVRKESQEEIKELFSGMTKKGYLYRDLAQNYPEMPTSIISGQLKEADSVFSTKFSDIVTGKCVLPTFKKGTPIYTPKNKLIFTPNEDNDFNLKWFDKIEFSTVLGRDRSDNRTMIERGSSGEYQLCDSTIQIKDKKIFLLLVLKIPQNVVHLDSEITVGVDLGISLTAVAALNKGLKRLNINNTILKPRQKLQRQKKQLQKELKYSEGGKGRLKKLKRLERVGKAESNFVRTANHKISKGIIDFALKNNAHKIYLENLTGISREKKNEYILRNWSYFELQTMIEQKANKYGIIVEKISASYTSQVCNACGTKGERNHQTDFVCKNNDCKIEKINADYNAAKNIANGGVGLNYNKDTRLFFDSLDYGAVVCPKTEGNDHSVKPKILTKNVNKEVVIN